MNCANHGYPRFFGSCISFFRLFSLLLLQTYPWAHHLPAGSAFAWTDGHLSPSSISCQLHDLLAECREKGPTLKPPSPPPGSPAAEHTQPTSSAISSRALLLLSHRDRYMVVSFSSFLIFLVIWVMGQTEGNDQGARPSVHLCLPWGGGTVPRGQDITGRSQCLWCHLGTSQGKCHHHQQGMTRLPLLQDNLEDALISDASLRGRERL